MKKTNLAFITSVILILAAFFRLWQISVLPVSLYWEEVALGYDSYSLLKTGMDHHGNPWPIVAMESFGDWKPTAYFYALLPSISVFGLSSLAIRLPAMIAGFLLVLGSGVLAIQIFWELKPTSREHIFLWTIFVAAFSSWGIMFSRAGWEVMLASSILVWGVVCFRQFLHSKKLIFGLAGVVLLLMSMYTYHATRLIAPGLGLFLIIEWYLTETKNSFELKKIQKFINTNKISLSLFVLVTLLIGWPLLNSLSSPEVQQRFNETSRFAAGDSVQITNSLRELSPGLLGKVFFHRYYYSFKQILTGYFHHLNFSFLFLAGDANARHSTSFFGIFYYFDLIWISMGIYWLVNNWKPKYLFLLGWLIIGLLPASLSTASPHALRILPTFPVWMIVIGLGIFQFTKMMEKTKWMNKQFWIGIVCAIILLQFGWFWRVYSNVYSPRHFADWQFGAEQMVQKVSELEFLYPDKDVYVSRWQGRPAMYYFFYNQVDPVLVQQANSVSKMDQSEFLEFGKVHFIDHLSQVTPDSIVALSAQEYSNLTNISINDIPLEMVVSWQDEDPIWVVSTFPVIESNQ